MRNILFLFLFAFLILIFDAKVKAAEPLIKYNIEFQKDKDGNRIPDRAATYFRNGSNALINPNSPKIGDPDDCYPDDLSNPKGNILISGSITDKETNAPINGAVVAVYMGAEHLNNISDNLGSADRFIVGEGDRLTNLYYYDVSKNGYFTVYACNDYKKLSEDKIKRYGNNFCLDGYVKNQGRCTHFDYVKAFPKFYIAVLCGMSGYELSRRTNNPDNYRKEMDNAKLKPWIGEILSVENFNEPYKGANAPDFLSRKEFHIKVNCAENLQPFPVPMFLEYTSSDNVASCRMDDVSPDLVNYFKKIQSPLRSSNYDIKKSLVTGSTKIPDINSLKECLDPLDPLCPKNFIKKGFPEPDKQKNFFDYGNKAYTPDSTSSVNANPQLREEIFSYNTSRGLHGRKIDFERGNDEDPKSDYLPLDRGSYQGQIDGKIDAKTTIDDVKFDLNSLKDLYACFTTFNFPLTRSSSSVDEQEFSKANPALSRYYTPNLRIPSCKELYCGGQFIPENEICKVRKVNEDNGIDFRLDDTDRYTQINVLSGYGPGVTMTLKSKKDITLELMALVSELIKSDFNPKKPLPNVKYKPVNKITDIIACYADDGKPVLLNEDGSISYESKLGSRNFFSPVPMISFLSIPYNIEFLHAISNDNYANKAGANSYFSEECNYGDPNSADLRDKQFANCRSAVIPGGVYSVSALRVIAKMCKDNTRLPGDRTVTYSDKAEKSFVMPNVGITADNEQMVELAVTKIGTPNSLCLCDPNSPTAGCNNNSKLNNDSSRNFGVASFVGDNSQNKGNNYLGTLCNMEKDLSKTTTCSEILKNSPNNVKGSSNFLGGSDNVRVAWAYSLKDMEAGYEVDYFFHHVTEPGDEIPQTNHGALPNLNIVPFISYVNGQKTEDYVSDKACVALYKSGDEIPGGKGVGDCKSYVDFKQEVKEENISSMQKPFNIPEPTLTETPTVGLYDKDVDASGNPTLKNVGYANLYQRTKDGTSGYIYTKYQYLNQKYDPIPDLLNDFREYTIYGIIPGGSGNVCRTPKLATLVDFKTTEYISNSRDARANQDGLTMNFAVSRGLLCNEVIPDELDRCETGEDVTPGDNQKVHDYSPADECKLRKCLTLCSQLYQTYEFYTSRSEFFNRFIESATTPALTIDAPTDPSGNPLPYYARKNVNERVYFCKNSDPKAKNVALEMNKGDEGCVIDYTRKIREVYTLPRKTDLETVGRNAYSYEKFNYPVYNNQICINPVNQLNFAGKDKNSQVNDFLNCKPYIGPQRPNDFQ